MLRKLFLIALLFVCRCSFAQIEDSIVTPNAVLHFYKYGKGTPIILLSGGPGISSHQEDDLAVKLSEKYKAILFDQRGTGKSHAFPIDSTNINLEVYLQDLELLRKKLGLNEMNLCGHSWGAILASAYTAKYPDKVNSIILIGGGELDNNLAEVVQSSIDVRFQLSDTTAWYYWNNPQNVAKDSVKAANEIRKINWSLLIFDRSKVDAVMTQAAHGIFNKKINALMWKEMQHLNINRFSPIAKSFKGKALLLYGWQDPIGLATLTSYQKVFPTAFTIGINNCGHMPSVEQPELFYTAIFDFLQKSIK